MKFRIFVSALCLLQLRVAAQHDGFSYELQNEIGTYKLVSLTFSHKIDNSEGISYVLEKKTGDTVYSIDRFLNGWAALSRDGHSVAHWISHQDRQPLSKSELNFYHHGTPVPTEKLGRSIEALLAEAKQAGRIPKSGWLKNDSALHKMATNPFFVSDDKLFLSFDDPKLIVFEMGRIMHVYSGNGANHFTLNYYSIPNAPYRTRFDTKEYVPKSFPLTIDSVALEDVLKEHLDLKVCLPEEAKFRVELEIKLGSDGAHETRKWQLYSTRTNELDEKRSEHIRSLMDSAKFDTMLIPPGHPAWIFEAVLWLK